jgi:hypothetical protein
MNDKYLTLWIHFLGKYCPKNFLDKYDYPCKIIYEINTIAKNGRDKGKLSEKSFCFFEIGNLIEDSEKIKKAVELAIRLKRDAKTEGIKFDYFDFTLAYSGIQGNMELSKDEIKWLRKLNCGVSMQYFQNKTAKDRRLSP